MRAGIGLLSAVAACIIETATAAPASAQGITERVSLGPGGAQGNGFSEKASISANGRFVAFISFATNLVPGDTNAADDVFVHDRQASVTRRVSVGAGRAQANGGSGGPAILADGRFVAFSSAASNLVPGDTNGVADVFVRDRQAGVTRRVSLGPDGVQANNLSENPAISADGRFVAFASRATNLVSGDINNQGDVFVRDRYSGITRRVSLGPGGTQGNGGSFDASISADGRFVAFGSAASNLVARDTNGSFDVFVRDRRMGLTRRVSVGPGGAQGKRF